MVEIIIVIILPPLYGPSVNNEMMNEKYCFHINKINKSIILIAS